MDPQEALVAFVSRVLVPAKARRMAALVATEKGRSRILNSLDHDFERAIRPGAVRPVGRSVASQRPCYVFHQSIGFGHAFASVREAYARLSNEEGWLIVFQDASAGIFR